MVENKSYTLKENSAILIPANKFHSSHSEKKSISYISFMCDCDCEDVIIKAFSKDLISELFNEIEAGNISDACNYLFFIQNKLYSKNIFRIKDTYNYPIQIAEFFSKYYSKNIQVSDLAKELHVSPTQAQRLSKKYTGKTFGENLLIQRMTNASKLINSGEMSLQQIATYVGYASYSGFYKAYKKFENSNKNNDTE